MANEAEELLQSLIGISVPSEIDTFETTSGETYQLPVRVGRQGKMLDDGDQPWIVGYFSPNTPTDKNHAFHDGVDLKAPAGTPMYPIASGIVIDVGVSSKGGNYLKVAHEDNTVVSYYAHLQKTTVQKGQVVGKQTVIGLVGDSGNAKNRGAHVHYTVKVNGSLVNPLSIVGKSVGTLSRRANLLLGLSKLAIKFELGSLA